MIRKEIIFAIVIGLVIGFVILYGIQVANKSAQLALETKPTPAATEVVIDNTPTPDNRPVIITSPADHSVSFANSVTITGKTSPNAQVALLSDTDDIITTSDANGNFSTTFSLVGGENTITVTVFTADKQTFNTKFSVIYTTAKIDQ